MPPFTVPVEAALEGMAGDRPGPGLDRGQLAGLTCHWPMAVLPTARYGTASLRDPSFGPCQHAAK